MGDEDRDRQRIFSFLRPTKEDHDIEKDSSGPANGSISSGLLDEIESVYENLRFRREPEALLSAYATQSRTPKRSRDKHVEVDTTSFIESNPASFPYSTVPRRPDDKHMRVSRQDSGSVGSENDTKTHQKTAYQQELRKSSLKHVSDTNSIPVLEGLRQWASYRRISREKSEEHPGEREKIYDVPDINLNPWITYRRAPKSYPELPQTWGESTDELEQHTIISPLESYNWADILDTEQSPAGPDLDLTQLHAPPRKPPPRKSALKGKTKPILKRQINITRNDLKGSQPQSEDKADKIKKRLGLFKGQKSKTGNLENTGSDGDGGTEGKKIKTPFFYCRLITEYPKTAFVLALCGHLLIMIVTVILLLAEYDLFPTDFKNLPMYDWTVPWRRRDMAWRFRNDYDDRYPRKLYLQAQPKWYRSLEYARGNIMLFYDAGKENIFNKQNFKQMELIENSVASMPEYLKYCVQDASFRCKKPNSILRYFDGTYTNINPVFYDPNYDRIPAVLYTAFNMNQTKEAFSVLLAKEHSISPQYAHASLARSVIPLGYPMRDAKNIQSMEEEMQRFLVNSFKPFIKNIKSNTQNFDLVYWSYLLFIVDIAQQATKEILLALGSFTFIFCFIVYHTKSLWISTFAVMSIGTSFLASNMIYRIVLDFRYFGLFHIIAIFIILGIGADDLFVFLDVWKNTAFTSYPSLGHRLSDAYKRSVLSMLITSLTTVIAFFASAFSPLLPARSFGVFAGLLVIVNYISVVIFFPTVVIMHHLYFEECTWPCFSCCGMCCCLCKQKPTETKTDNSTSLANGTAGSCGGALSCTGKSSSSGGLDGHTNNAFEIEKDMEYGFIPADQEGTKFSYTAIEDVSRTDTNSFKKHNELMNDAVTYTEINQTATNKVKGAVEVKEKKLLVKFFRNHFYRFVTNRIAKWVILVVLSLLVIFFIYSVTRLEPDNEQVKYYRGGTNYGKALQFDSHGFVGSSSDRSVSVYIAWGLRPRDVSACHFSDQFCEGVESFDNSFDPNSEQAQIALMNFCDTLLNFSPEEIKRFHIRRDMLTGRPEIRCFMKELRDFLRRESFATGVDWSLPWGYTKTLTFMWNKPQFYDTSKFNQTFKNLLQIPISYWLNDGYRFWNTTNFQAFHPLIGEATGPFSTPLRTDFSKSKQMLVKVVNRYLRESRPQGVIYGNKIKYIGVQVNLTLGRFSTGYKTGKPVMDRWEEFVSSQMRQMPPGLRKGFQLTSSLWHTLSIQQTMAESAIFGIVLGILCALPILTLATQNIIIGFFATLSMCCTTVSVIGVISLIGWKLGLLESLNMCMVVGLSVDYVVHLAEGYHMSGHADRLSRVRDMLEEVGISVFSGACTTLGASVFLLFAQIQFLVKFGIFMFCTIGFSLIFSLGFFTTIMGLIGPNGRTGNIGELCAKPLCCRGKKSTDSGGNTTQTSIEETDSDRL